MVSRLRIGFYSGIFAFGRLMPSSPHTSAPRFSCSEFTTLIQAHLNELEARPDATHHHRVLLAVLRQELAQHTNSSSNAGTDQAGRQVA